MTEEFKKLKVADDNKRLTFIFAGYRYEQSMAQSVLIQVTNTTQQSADKFMIATLRDPRPFGFFGFGMKAGVAVSDRERLKELLLQERPAEALVNKAVETICNAG